MGMFTGALMLAVLEAASGATHARPASVALTWEGAGSALEVVDFLRARVRETFDIDAASIASERAGDGDFHVHVVARNDHSYGVRVDEAGATIASRELIGSDDAATELWFFMKTTLRRALFSASSAPGGPRLDPQPGPETSMVAPASVSLVAPVSPPIPFAGVAVRALGGLAFGASALEKTGMAGVDYRFELGETSIFAGAEVGYFSSTPAAGTISVRRVPMSVTAGVRVFEQVPLVIGAFAGLDYVSASSALSKDSTWVGSYGPLARGSAQLFDRLSLVLDLRGRLTLPRVRYLLPDRESSILESAVSFSVTTGVEWRWQ